MYCRSMKPLTISDKENMILAIRNMRFGATTPPAMITGSTGVLLVAQGMTCPSVAQMLGDAHHTAVNWVQRFEANGLAGLAEGQTHRTSQSLE